MSIRTVYPSRIGLTRWAAGGRAALLALTLAAGGCAMPVSVPLGSLASLTGGGSESQDVEFTGSVGPVVEETGIAERIGIGAWPALRRAVARAVEGGEDGQTFAWSSERDGMAGTVTPVAAYFGEADSVCRRLAITAARSSESDVFVAEACRRDRGHWSLGLPSGGV